MKKIALTLSLIVLSSMQGKRASDDPRFQQPGIGQFEADQIGVIDYIGRKQLVPPVPFSKHLEEFPHRRMSRLTIKLHEPLSSQHAQPMTAYLSDADRHFIAGTLLKQEEKEEAKRYVRPYSRIREKDGSQLARGAYIQELVIQSSDGTKQLVFKKFPDRGRVVSYLFITPSEQELYQSLYFLKDKLLNTIFAGNNF